MPTEVTANIMIGAVSNSSHHGAPSSGATGKLFCPSHILVLMEGTRATWVVQRCPSVGRPTHGPQTRRICPSSPDHLLAAAVLGYTAMTQPDAVSASAELRDAVIEDASTGDVRIVPLDRDLASQVFDTCSAYVYAMVTALPGSSINDDELRLAADAGMQIAVAARSVDNAAVMQ